MNIELTTKVCGTCKESLPLDKFSRSKAKPDGLQSKCKDCTKTYYQDYYKNSPTEKDRILAKNAAHRASLREIVREKKSVPCADCDRSFPHYVMDFDHQYDKKFNIGSSVSSGLPMKSLLEEIDKCEVVCANCHRERTHGQWAVGELADPPSFGLGDF